MINAKKNLFILDNQLTYLNCASMSPMLLSVKEAGLQALDIRSAPWKLSSDDWFIPAEILRSLAAKVFQTSINSVALIPSASYGLAVAAKNLKPVPGKKIIVLENQFPSNYYVWQNLAGQHRLQMVTVTKSKGKNLTESILEKINNNTGIVAIPNCHWIDGTWIDLKKISEAAASTGASLVLDLSQSLGVLPIDIEAIQPDFAVSVGYKWLLGPYSLGYMYVSKKWQEAGEPLEYSWMTRKGSEDFTALTSYNSEYRDGARKFDMGEFSQFHSIPMAIAALDQILNWNIHAIQAALKELTDNLNGYKKSMGIYEDNMDSVGHIASLPLKNIDLKMLKERLLDNKVVVSFRGASIRISPHLYNDMNDINKLMDCLRG